MIFVDTKRLEEDALSIGKSIDNLKKIFEDLFSMLLNINKNGKVWTGPAADKYVKSLSYDKVEYLNYLSDLNEYYLFLKNAADEYIKDVGRII